MSRNHVRRALMRLAPVLLVAVLVSACSGGSGGIKVSGAWARTSSAMAAAGAAYMVIDNTGSSADALIGASSPIAKSTEVHETVEVPAATSSASGGPAGMSSPAASAGMGSGGMMGMQPVSRVEIPAGGRLELKPGSYHIMMIGLAQDLKVGEKVEMTLKFEKAGDVKVTLEVRAN